MEDFIEVNEISNFVSYIRSIEWRDPWLICLLVFHVALTLTCFITRHHVNFQIILFSTLLLLVYFSENINEFAAKNWTLFSRQQYFDSKGLFISVVFSMPILLNCIVMLGSWFYQSSLIMTNLRRAQIRQQYKEMSECKQNDHPKSD